MTIDNTNDGAESHMQLSPYTMPSAVLAAAALAADLSAAHAGNTGFYVGGGAGRAEYFTSEDACRELAEEARDAAAEEIDDPALLDAAFAVIAETAECSDGLDTTAYRIFLGYQFNDYIGLEAGYNDFGSVDISLSSNVSESGASFVGSGQGRAEVDGFTVSALLSVPIGDRFAIFGRAGVLAWDANASGSATGIITESDGSVENLSESFVLDDSGADGLYGAGVRFDVTDNVTVRAEWTRYELVDIDYFGADLIVYLR